MPEHQLLIAENSWIHSIIIDRMKDLAIHHEYVHFLCPCIETNSGWIYCIIYSLKHNLISYFLKVQYIPPVLFHTANIQSALNEPICGFHFHHDKNDKCTLYHSMDSSSLQAYKEYFSFHRWYLGMIFFNIHINWPLRRTVLE